jgi:hypothetical protein
MRTEKIDSHIRIIYPQRGKTDARAGKIGTRIAKTCLRREKFAPRNRLHTTNRPTGCRSVLKHAQKGESKYG